jgi:hypothetical protein
VSVYQRWRARMTSPEMARRRNRANAVRLPLLAVGVVLMIVAVVAFPTGTSRTVAVCVALGIFIVIDIFVGIRLWRHRHDP